MPVSRKDILRKRMGAQLRALAEALDTGEECVFCDEDGVEKARGKLTRVSVNLDRLEDGIVVRIDDAKCPIDLSAFQVMPASHDYESWKTLGATEADIAAIAAAEEPGNG